jgi:hypothetical protein
MDYPAIPPMPSSSTDWQRKFEQLEAEVERTRMLLRAVGEDVRIVGDCAAPASPTARKPIPVTLDHQVALYIARKSTTK